MAYRHGIRVGPSKEGLSAISSSGHAEMINLWLFLWDSQQPKMERAGHYDVSFIWLTSGLKPDHKTLPNE